MTKIKKVVALALAFLMIFSSASVLANAWTVTVDDGFDLAIGTKFFINDGTEWVETEKVAPGDNVKARVYIGTDYYSNSSTLLFFYDKDFFTHGYNGISDLSVNPEVGAFTGKLNPAPVLTSQVNAGYIDSAFLDEYAAISVNLFMPSGSTNAMYDDSTWIIEFDFTVADTATGEGETAKLAIRHNIPKISLFKHRQKQAVQIRHMHLPTRIDFTAYRFKNPLSQFFRTLLRKRQKHIIRT